VLPFLHRNWHSEICFWKVARRIKSDELDVDVVKGSALAASLVIKQCATSVASVSKALMEHPQWLTGLVFTVIEEGEGVKYHVVWQIVAFQEVTQKGGGQESQ
jgi:hypothetical protein